MEPSRFPDSPNKPSFPTTVIKAGEWFSGKTVYKFSVK
jgi:aldose 1-epimerase